MTTETLPTGPDPAREPAPEAQGPVPTPDAEGPADAPAPGMPVGPAMQAPPPTPTRRKRERALGTAGQVLGIVGIVVCLVLVAGVVVGRGWAVGTVDDVAAAVDAQIAKTTPLLDRAQATVGEVSGRVSTVADIAAGVAADPSPGGEIAQGLRTALASVSARYQGLREGYADVRETVVSLIDRLQTLDRLVPGLSIPQGPIDARATFDERLNEFDAKVTDLITIDPGQGPVNQAAARIAEAATGIEARLHELQDGIGQVEERISELRADVASAAATANTAITLATILLVVLLLYLALLHWVLFRHSGEIRRKTAAG